MPILGNKKIRSRKMLSTLICRIKGHNNTLGECTRCHKIDSDYVPLVLINTRGESISNWSAIHVGDELIYANPEFKEQIRVVVLLAPKKVDRQWHIQCASKYGDFLIITHEDKKDLLFWRALNKRTLSDVLQTLKISERAQSNFKTQEQINS